MRSSAVSTAPSGAGGGCSILPDMPSVIVITGASRGIGAATARRAAAAGYDVCVGYRHRGDAAAAVVGQCQEQGVRALAVAADVSVEADVVRLFATVDAELGPVRGLVNNAGVVDRQCRVEQMAAQR